MDKKHRITSTISWSCIAAVVVALYASNQAPVNAADQRGRVESTGSVRRISRPQEGRPVDVSASATEQVKVEPLSGSVDKFTLPISVDKTTLAPEASVSPWQPLSGSNTDLPSRSAQVSSEGPVRAGIPAAAKVAPVQTAIDYGAIEKAYAELIPPPLATVSQRPPAVASGHASCPFGPLVPTANGPMPAGSLPGFSGYRPVVAVDNCICDSPIPSAACPMNPVVGTYSPQGGGAPTPAIPGLNAPVAGPMGYGAAAGAMRPAALGRAIGTSSGR